MSLKRLGKKFLMGGGNLIDGHIADAIEKKIKNGKSFRENLEESFRETYQEDAPGVSHIYQKGRMDGRIQGKGEQAQQDEEKFQRMHEAHEKDRKRLKKQIKDRDDLLDEIEEQLGK